MRDNCRRYVRQLSQIRVTTVTDTCDNCHKYVRQLSRIMIAPQTGHAHCLR